MKRDGKLFEKLTDFETLRLAAANAVKGKKGMVIDAFKSDFDNKVVEVQRMLIDGTFRTSQYHVFKVYEPKEREIFALPFFPDRIVHHGVMLVLEPILYKVFTLNTFSCIKGRGLSKCALRVRKIIRTFARSPKLYCLKIDIRKFYPSVNHEVLKELLRKKIKDARFLALLDGIIDSADGLPIGNYTSQGLANFYLSYLMHYVNEVLKVNAVEYADDIVFFADNKAALHDTLIKVKDYVETRLKLELKGNYQIFPIADNREDKNGRALDYVGFKFYRRQTLLRKRIKQNLCRRVARLRHRRRLTAEQYQRATASWLGWCKYSNSRNLLKKLGIYGEIQRLGEQRQGQREC